MQDNKKRELDVTELPQEWQEKLEEMIGERISAYCSDEELDEFDAISDLSEGQEWLEKHVPWYDQIVLEEVEKIKEEYLEYKSQEDG